MKRRDFLKTTSLIGLPLIINGIPVGAVGRNHLLDLIQGKNDRVLVLIQMNGGNDGLNMVLPLDQYSNLSVARSKILIPEAAALPLRTGLGIHPAMTSMQNVWNDGKLLLAQSVGYPNQNRSHFRSTDIWTTATDANKHDYTGWLGRYFAEEYQGYPYGYPNTEYPDPIAITIGSNTSQTCQGEGTNFSLALTDPNALRILSEGIEDQYPNSNYGDELRFLNGSIVQTNDYTQVIQNANTKSGPNLSTKYPADNTNALSTKLKTVARLINGGLQTKVYIVNISGFDTHSAQCDPTDHTIGNHANLLKMLSDAVYAFLDDIQLMGHGERVIGMTFSEFGRRIKANDSTGTDHGTAAPLFMFGSCINPVILGDNPTINPTVANDEGVAMQIDFRSLYASVLVDWFEMDASQMSSVLFKDFTKLPIIKGCSPTTDNKDLDQIAFDFKLSPNPAKGDINISFESEDDNLRISLFDTIGSELEVIYVGRVSAGSHNYKLDADKLAPGNYYVRIASLRSQKTKSFVKI
ncbi:MAG: DUF1501 domain-containing protein [Bacteroidota bacterium]|nr:DUF1501 domain-containing protein [Bacteroidota bacterium]